MAGPATSREIPFEPQPATPGARTCGAAALCMVYRSFGLDCSADEVWADVARGRRVARTHWLCRDAVRRGLSGLIVQAGDPWAALRRCAADGLCVILNHRLGPAKPEGHYTVLVNLDDEGAVVHDPAMGPGRRVGREEFLRLWKPSLARSEIVGHVFVALTDRPAAEYACPACGTGLPARHVCGSCRMPFALQPAAALGCTSADCPERTWRRVYCPQCDEAVDRLPQADSGGNRAVRLTKPQS